MGKVPLEKNHLEPDIRGGYWKTISFQRDPPVRFHVDWWESSCLFFGGLFGAGGFGVFLWGANDTLWLFDPDVRCGSDMAHAKHVAAIAFGGFYGPPDSFEGSGESLIIADPDEALRVKWF